jgi:hypothetical protein
LGPLCVMHAEHLPNASALRSPFGPAEATTSIPMASCSSLARQPPPFTTPSGGHRLTPLPLLCHYGQPPLVSLPLSNSPKWDPHPTGMRLDLLPHPLSPPIWAQRDSVPSLFPRVSWAGKLAAHWGQYASFFFHEVLVKPNQFQFKSSKFE